MKKPILFVKTGCPYCHAALEYFKEHNVDLEIHNVRENPKDMQKLVDVSGQHRTPTFIYGDFIVKDFDIDEFKAALEQAPKIKKELGL